MNASVETVSGVIDEVVQLANNMTSVITLSTARSFMDTVKLDHVLYKMDIYRAILGLNAMTADDFADHTSCRLGNWYYEGEGQRLVSFDNYRKLEVPHKNVHEAGKKAVTLHKSGQHEASISALSEMENASKDVLTQLDLLAPDYQQVMLDKTRNEVPVDGQTGDIDLF